MTCDVIISPSILSGEINVPASKSLAHRAIIGAALSRGKSVIKDTDINHDIGATIDCTRALGADIKLMDKNLIINGGINNGEPVTLHCGKSATTLRLLLPVALALTKNVKAVCDETLLKRPMGVYENLFKEKGAVYTQTKREINVKGELPYGNYSIDGNISSQFISGLLFALPLLKGDSVINIKYGLSSKGYITQTINTLNSFGIMVNYKEADKLYVNGNQRYTSADIMPEKDFSQAAFFLAAGALGGNVRVMGLPFLTAQPDKAIINILIQSGCVLKKHNDGIGVSQAYFGNTVDIDQMPDLFPAVAVLLSLCKGKSRIINAGRLSYKESDRLRVMERAINTLGGKTKIEGDTFLIDGVEAYKGGAVDCCNDHRIAMALSIASSRLNGDMRIIGGKDAVNKSYPRYWDDYKKLGGVVQYG